MYIDLKWIIIILIILISIFYAKDDFKESGIGAGIYGLFIIGLGIISSLIIYIIFEKLN